MDIFYGDIKELATVRQAIRDIDVVFNLAALVGIPYSFKNPQEVVGTNTIGTLNVWYSRRVQLQRQLGVRCIFY